MISLMTITMMTRRRITGMVMTARRLTIIIMTVLLRLLRLRRITGLVRSALALTARPPDMIRVNIVPAASALRAALARMGTLVAVASVGAASADMVAAVGGKRQCRFMSPVSSLGKD